MGEVTKRKENKKNSYGRLKRNDFRVIFKKKKRSIKFSGKRFVTLLLIYSKM